jgi:hypothetical protein
LRLRKNQHFRQRRYKGGDKRAEGDRLPQADISVA